MYCTDPALNTITAGEDIDDLSVDGLSVDYLSDVCIIPTVAGADIVIFL